MASLNDFQSGKAANGRKAIALPKVDLTAMVDLAFLLITFFMLTTSLAKQKAMEIAKPVDTTASAYPASRTMTIVLAKNNQAIYYMGESNKAQLQVIPIALLKAKILANKLIVSNSHSGEVAKQMLVIIKPTSTSVYKNFVDVIDEMNINAIGSYVIDDKNLTTEEQAFLKAKNI